MPHLFEEARIRTEFDSTKFDRYLPNGLFNQKIHYFCSDNVQSVNTPQYIAQKMGEEPRKGSRVVRISSMIVTGSVALSIAVIMIALSVVNGFRKEIRESASGFVGQIILSPFGTDYMDDAFPLSLELSYLDKVAALSNISHIQSFAFRHGLIRSGEAMQGVVIKGVGKEFDASFFNASLSQGSFPEWNDSIPSLELLISKRMANDLQVEATQRVDLYFIEESTPRIRRFTVSGIYDAALEEMDRLLAIGDIRVVQQLNGWTPKEVGGIELLLRHPSQMERTAREVQEIAALFSEDEDDSISVKTVKDIFAHLFDWLNLIDMNLLIVLVLMIAVAGVNMISGLLIMLFDKTSMIGLLKSLGMKNREIRLAFIYRMGRLILKGMVLGNIIALIVCIAQKRFTLIRLDPANYAVSSVPIDLNVWSILLMNVISFALILTLMLLASLMVTRISPERSLRTK